MISCGGGVCVCVGVGVCCRCVSGNGCVVVGRQVRRCGWRFLLAEYGARPLLEIPKHVLAQRPRQEGNEGELKKRRRREGKGREGKARRGAEGEEGEEVGG